jgi:hypothetical protein
MSIAIGLLFGVRELTGGSRAIILLVVSLLTLGVVISLLMSISFTDSDKVVIRNPLRTVVVDSCNAVSVDVGFYRSACSEDISDMSRWSRSTCVVT